MVLLFFSYSSNNPLSSCLALILALIVIGPVLVVNVSSWKVYLLLMLFLTGILVVVLYFSSVSGIVLVALPRSILLCSGLVLFFPYSVSSLSSVWTSALFSVESLLLVLIVITCLASLVLFASYMLSHTSAIRKM